MPFIILIIIAFCYIIKFSVTGAQAHDACIKERISTVPNGVWPIIHLNGPRVGKDGEILSAVFLCRLIKADVWFWALDAHGMEWGQSITIGGVCLKADLYTVYGCSGTIRDATADDTSGQSKTIGLLRKSIRIHRLFGVILLTIAVTLHTILIISTCLRRVILIAVYIRHSWCRVYGLIVCLLRAAKHSALHVEVGGIGTFLVHVPCKTHGTTIGSTACHYTPDIRGTCYRTFDTTVFAYAEGCLLCRHRCLVFIRLTCIGCTPIMESAFGRVCLNVIFEIVGCDPWSGIVFGFQALV